MISLVGSNWLSGIYAAKIIHEWNKNTTLVED
jgi:hypothetical protein